jgi:hypothetical protein
MRRHHSIIIILTIAVTAFAGTWWALRSPYYSLYQIGKAIHTP